MITTDTDIIATGGFNTGRKYTAEGQRIFWAQRADGWVYFKDADRMIDGWVYFNDADRMLSAWIKRDGTLPASHPISPERLMKRYDAGAYEYKPEGGHPARIEIPADFDYGTALRI
jgi:hypothetical protein